MIAPTQTPMERSLKHLALARTFNELFNDLISQAEDMAYHVASFHQVHEWKPTGTAANLSYEERSDSVSFTLGRQAIQYEIQSLDGVSIERLAQGVAHAFLRRRRQMVAETSYCVARVCAATAWWTPCTWPPSMCRGCLAQLARFTRCLHLSTTLNF